MANMEKIWLNSVSDGDRLRHELRIDWDNDRHQAIHLDSLAPEDVEAGLVRASIELNQERCDKEI